jgi:hypothetical protein
MSMPYDVVDRILREGKWSPARKRRCKPWLCLQILPSECAILRARTWQGDRIYRVLSPEEVQAWNAVLKRSRVLLTEGDVNATATANQ